MEAVGISPRFPLNRLRPPDGAVDFGDQKIERVKSLELLSTSLANARSAAYRRFGVESGPAYKSRNSGGVECELLTTEPSLGWPNVHDPRTLVRAYRSAVQSIASGVFTKIVFDLESEDRSGEHNVGDGLVTVTRAGVYLVTGQVRIDALGDGDIIQCAIYKEAAVHALNRIRQGGAGIAVCNIVSLVECGAGNTIGIYAQHSFGANRDVVAGAENTFFCVFGPL